MRVPPALLASGAALALLLGAVALTHPSPAAVSVGDRAQSERFLQITAGGMPSAKAVEAEEAAGSARAVARPHAGCRTRTGVIALLPNGWCLSPAGRGVDVLRFPLGVLPTSDGHVVVSSDSGGVQGLTVIDQKSLNAQQTTAANAFVGLAETADHRVYAAGGNADRVYRYSLVGGKAQSQDVTEAVTAPVGAAVNGVTSRLGTGTALPVVDGIRVTAYPGALQPWGPYVLAAGTLSEPSSGACPTKQSVCGRISVIDTRTDTVIGRAGVGRDPFALAVDPAKKVAYVANWADESGRGNGVGTVSVIDLHNPRAPREIAWVKVGHHPVALQLTKDRRRLFVANTNDDSISVVDVTRAPKVVATQSVRPVEGAPAGAHPDALALSPDGRTLFVALAGANAVEVLDGGTGARVAGHPMYIPTGWYPSALAVTGTASKYRLWVTNAKGVGPSVGYNASVVFNGSKTQGTLNVVDLPVAAKTANAWTSAVRSNDSFEDAAVDPCAAGRGVTVSQVLCPPKGTTSPLKHVVFVVTENKTFDQYFGDLPTGDNGYRADPTYALYGQAVTPNHHKLAGPYSLGDNFFSDAEVSVTGHSWTSGAVATDHNEKTWQADYDQGLRGSHGNGDPLKGPVTGAPGKAIQEAEDELNDPEGGYLFEAFKRAGATPPSDHPGRLSMAIYGESTARSSKGMDAYQAPGWKKGDISYSDTCRVLTLRDGKAPDGPSPAFSVGGGPAGFATNDCDGRTLATPFTLKHWVDVYNKTGRDIMPSFLYVSLPQNHTLATTLGSPTPQSMVADNDYALGLLIESLSRSPFWKSTAVLQTEDDTQVAGDHVSALRDYLTVASPWAKPGPNHQYGSMPAVLRTIEQVFGVAPISLFDRLAVPMHEAFLPKLSKPNLTPYTAVRGPVPFGLNTASAPGSALSKTLDFTTYDRVDEQLLNAILYAQARHTKLVLQEP